MNKYDKLLLQIASELNICRGETESDTSYKARLIYSAVSRIGYSSLWDMLEDDVPVSIIHFRRRVENVLGSYIKMYPEVEKLFPEKFDDISKEMLDIFTNTGIIYHSPNRIAPSVKCQADFKSISFLRGTPLSYKINLSGTGAYLATDEKKSEISSVRDMFGLSSKNITDIWEHYLSQAKWSVMTSKENFEYLRTKPKFTSGYWTDIPDKDGKTSLMRTNLQGLNMYFFYKSRDNKIEASQIPYWLTDNFSYLYLANGCLASRSSLPENTYQTDGAITYLQIGYPFPPNELAFLKLYSWPQNYVNVSSDFSRVINTEVFIAIKEILSRIGYKFKEEL